VALGQVFSEYFGFPCQSSFHQLLPNHPHLSSGAGTIGQKWPQYKGLSPTPLAIKETSAFETALLNDQWTGIAWDFKFTPKLEDREGRPRLVMQIIFE
jgi:hypothetical protein